MYKTRLIIAAAVILTGWAGCKEGISGERMENGKKLYATYCQSCHMENGGGVPNMNAPLAGSAYVTGDKEKLITIVLKGSDAFANDPPRSFKNLMASMAHLTDEQIADILTYARNSFTNTATAIQPGEVRTVREKKN